MGQPARNHSWPPFEPGNAVGRQFEPGNELRLTHGADSERRVAPLAARLKAELLEAAPWCDRPAYRSAVGSWSWVEAQWMLVAAYLDEHGILDGQGMPRPAAALQDRLERRAAKLRVELGLTPMSFGRLLLMVAAVKREQGGHAGALEQLLAEGRAALECAVERQLTEKAVGE